MCFLNVQFENLKKNNMKIQTKQLSKSFYKFMKMNFLYIFILVHHKKKGLCPRRSRLLSNAKNR